MVIYGITSKIVKGINIVEAKRNKCNYYCFCDGWKKSNREPWSKAVQCPRLKNGDTASICLDLKQKTIKFLINGDERLAFDNVKTSNDISYRLFVTLYHESECVEILDCLPL